MSQSSVKHGSRTRFTKKSIVTDEMVKAVSTGKSVKNKPTIEYITNDSASEPDEDAMSESEKTKSDSDIEIDLSDDVSIGTSGTIGTVPLVKDSDEKASVKSETMPSRQDNIKQDEKDLDSILLGSINEGTIDLDEEHEEPEPKPKKITKTKKPVEVSEHEESDHEESEPDEMKSQKITKKKTTKKKATKAIKSLLDDDAIETKTVTSTSTASVPKKKKTKAKTVGVKKGPGRPRKTPKKEPIPRKGITQTPINDDSLVELVYSEPNIMKKIFQFFKAIEAKQIQIIFRPTEVIFYARDHLEATHVRIRVDANKLNNYYCASVLDIGVTPKDMLNILGTVDKEYISMTWLSEMGTSAANTTIVLENDMEIDEQFSVKLVANYQKMQDETKFLDDDYTIKFDLPSKYFKRTINYIKTLSLELYIVQEDADSPMFFEYSSSNKRIKSKYTVKNANRIKFDSKLKDGETFRVAVRVDFLKPIASSQIADEITIMVDENKQLMTVAYIDDGAIEIKTLTNIIRKQEEEED